MTKKSQKKSSKGVTLDLNTFLTTPAQGEFNWAEEMEEQPTTTTSTSSGGLTLEELRASSSAGDNTRGGYSKGGFGYSARQESNFSREIGSTESKVKPPSFFSEGAPQKPKTSQFESSSSFREERRERKQHPQHELPTEKPFVAFIGNLNYDVTKEDLQEFFGTCHPINVSIPRDKETHKIKGYGYVEFDTVEDLKSALELNGENVLDRAIKIDIAAPETASKVTVSNRDNFRQNREGGFRQQQHRPRDDFEERRQPPSIADKSDNWRSGGDDLGDINPFGNSKKKAPTRKPNQQQENASPFGSFNRKPKEGSDETKPVQEKSKPSPFGEGKAWEPKEKDLQGPNLDIYTSKKPKERTEKKEHVEKKEGGEDKDFSGFQTATSKPRGGRRYAQQGTRGGFTKKRGGANSSSRTNDHNAEEAEGEHTESNNPYAALSEQTDE
ncbi:hypothetical protein FDP41_005237 [Naegleria fowleri]|uniref:RRM domain-containing protein n=1 Tax=Naegleria fowleri TaxID=5763 RepID=A0A6A5BPQ6_NAEFO|nr:uncharacterized protein FDP41_005237 [Naegleria fowleri]KAF0975910.1 hypothetical protein FDP41_005237 [Naegleria fowleri]